MDAAELGALPEGWEWANLEECSQLITKGESPNWQGFNYVDDGIPFVRSENVLWGRVELSGVARVPVEFHRKLKRSQLAPNDVLINLVGASIGRCGIVPPTLKEANINQAVGIIRLTDILLQSYLLNVLLSPQMQKIIQGSKVETARANISLIDLRGFMIPLPSLAEQQQIVMEVERRLSVADEAERTVDASLKQAARLRQSILKRAFAGKLVPQDPSDESAERLVERIRAARDLTVPALNGAKGLKPVRSGIKSQRKKSQ